MSEYGIFSLKDYYTETGKKVWKIFEKAKAKLNILIESDVSTMMNQTLNK